MQRTNHGSFNWFAKATDSIPFCHMKNVFTSNTYIHRGIYVQIKAQFSSVSQSCLTLCDPMDTRPPCPSLTTGVHTNTCPLSQWCHPTISSSVIPFSSYLQSFPASASFPMSQFFASDWSKYWSFSFSVSPSSEYSGLISFRIDCFDVLAVRWEGEWGI